MLCYTTQGKHVHLKEQEMEAALAKHKALLTETQHQLMHKVKIW